MNYIALAKRRHVDGWDVPSCQADSMYKNFLFETFLFVHIAQIPQFARTYVLVIMHKESGHWNVFIVHFAQ